MLRFLNGEFALYAPLDTDEGRPHWQESLFIASLGSFWDELSERLAILCAAKFSEK